MATYEQLATALRNAHAAGDTVAATKLATALKGMGGAAGQPANIDFEGRFNPPQRTAGAASGKGDMLAPVADNRDLPAGNMQEQGPSALRSFGYGAADMASLGFGDEIAAGLKTGFGLAGNYNHTVEGIRAQEQAAQQAHPIAYGAGQVAGALPTAFVPAGAAARGVGLAARMGAGALAAGAQGAVYGAGSADGSLADRARGAAIGGATGAVAGAALPVVGHAVGNAFGRSAGRAAVPTVDELKTSSQSLYRAAEQQGLRIAPQSFQGAVNRISQIARGQGIDPTLHPDAWAALGRLEQAAGSSLDLKEADTLRQILGDAAQAMKPKDRQKARDLLTAFDDYMSHLQPGDVTAGNPRAAIGLLKEARSLWTRKAKGSVIEGAFQNAADAKSGLENGLRSEFGKLLKSPKYNWTADERAAIRQVVRGGVKANALRFLGTFGYSPDQARSFLGTVIGAGAGGALGGGIGAVALPAVGTAARFASRSLAKSRANDVSALVRNGGVVPFDAGRAAAVTDRVDPLLRLGGQGIAVPLTLDTLRR